MTCRPALPWILPALLTAAVACNDTPPTPIGKRVDALVGADRWWDALDALEAHFQETPAPPDAALRLVYAHCLARCDRSADASHELRRLLDRGEVDASEFLEVCSTILEEDFRSDAAALLRTGTTAFPAFEAAFRATLRRHDDRNRNHRVSLDTLHARSTPIPNPTDRPIHWLDAPGPGYREMADPYWREIWLEEYYGLPPR